MSYENHRDVDRCQWKGCGVEVPHSSGVRYLGRLLCDKHWARTCVLSSTSGNGAYLHKMLGLPWIESSVVPAGEDGSKAE